MCWGIYTSLCYKFPTESNGERILKIGKYLVKLLARVRCLVSFDSQCSISSHNNNNNKEGKGIPYSSRCLKRGIISFFRYRLLISLAVLNVAYSALTPLVGLQLDHMQSALDFTPDR